MYIFHTNIIICVLICLYIFKEIVLTEEELEPELLKILNDVFEFDLPLGHVSVAYNSEVIMIIMILKINSIKKYVYFFI